MILIYSVIALEMVTKVIVIVMVMEIDGRVIIIVI